MYLILPIVSSVSPGVVKCKTSDFRISLEGGSDHDLHETKNTGFCRSLPHKTLGVKGSKEEPAKKLMNK